VGGSASQTTQAISTRPLPEEQTSRRTSRSQHPASPASSGGDESWRLKGASVSASFLRHSRRVPLLQETTERRNHRICASRAAMHPRCLRDGQTFRPTIGAAQEERMWCEASLTCPIGQAHGMQTIRTALLHRNPGPFLRRFGVFFPGLVHYGCVDIGGASVSLILISSDETHSYHSSS
jgi:hypothetical protein